MIHQISKRCYRLSTRAERNIQWMPVIPNHVLKTLPLSAFVCFAHMGENPCFSTQPFLRGKEAVSVHQLVVNPKTEVSRRQWD